MAETNRRNELNLNPLEGMVSVYSSGRSDEHVQLPPPQPMAVNVHYPAMTEPYHGPLDGTSRHPELEAMPMEAHVSAYHHGRSDEHQQRPIESHEEAAEPSGGGGITTRITSLFKRTTTHEEAAAHPAIYPLIGG